MKASNKPMRTDFNFAALVCHKERCKPFVLY